MAETTNAESGVVDRTTATTAHGSPPGGPIPHCKKAHPSAQSRQGSTLLTQWFLSALRCR